MRRESLRPTDLKDAEFILGDMSEWGEYRWRLADLFRSNGVAPRIRLEASNTLALIGLVAAGLGVTIYPESLIGLLGPNVEVRPIEHPDFHSETVLAWKRIDRSGPTRRFVEVATKSPATYQAARELGPAEGTSRTSATPAETDSFRTATGDTESGRGDRSRVPRIP